MNTFIGIFQRVQEISQKNEYQRNGNNLAHRQAYVCILKGPGLGWKPWCKPKLMRGLATFRRIEASAHHK